MPHSAYLRVSYLNLRRIVRVGLSLRFTSTKILSVILQRPSFAPAACGTVLLRVFSHFFFVRCSLWCRVVFILRRHKKIEAKSCAICVAAATTTRCESVAQIARRDGTLSTLPTQHYIEVGSVCVCVVPFLLRSFLSHHRLQKIAWRTFNVFGCRRMLKIKWKIVLETMRFVTCTPCVTLPSAWWRGTVFIRWAKQFSEVRRIVFKETIYFVCLRLVDGSRKHKIAKYFRNFQSTQEFYRIYIIFFCSVAGAGMRCTDETLLCKQKNRRVMHVSRETESSQNTITQSLINFRTNTYTFSIFTTNWSTSGAYTLFQKQSDNFYFWGNKNIYKTLNFIPKSFIDIIYIDILTILNN